MIKKRKIILLVAAAIGIFGIAALAVNHYRSPAEADDAADAAEEKSAQVVTQVVEERTLASAISTFGDIVPARTVGISSAYPGQVSELLVIQGQMVSKGKPLAVIISDPATQMAYRQAQTAAKLSEAELKRTQELYRLQLATQSQVDTAQKALDDAQATLAEQKALGGGTPSATLNAPADGIISTLTVAQGDRVAAAAPMMQLSETGSLKVLLGVDPSDRLRIKKGAAVDIASLNDDAQTTKGKVIDVQDGIDPKTQLTNVVVKIDGADKRFITGMRVSANIAAEERKAFVVQRQAVLNDEKGDYLFQVSKAKAHRVEVDTVVDNSSLLGVTGELDPHAPVVISGNYELEDGMSVREGSR
ncbi:MAG TPA: efflux RND transporter periplasmic adaptor subunit [Herbaspirillum sp.]|jgi:membrane fusion protein (multidrug efflux system)|nr:efflux RND transporter periplasmic adaptor subunit [Herbaspirillum sp.]